MSGPVSPTALVTGATEGIGFETARRLAAGGWNVIVHATTAGLGDDAVRRLVGGGADPLRLEVAVADFTRLTDVATLADQVLDGRQRLDVLVNNAAIAGPERRTLTVDDNEVTFQVNYLAPYLLTRMLAGRLDAATRGRVVNLSSSLHVTANLDWADPQRRHRYAPLAAYAQSKLALSMFTRALARSEEHRFTSVSVHPGVVRTGLMSLYSRIGQPVGDAGAVVAHLASPQVAVVDGAYYQLVAPAQAAALVDNASAVQRLWKLSARLTGLQAPAIPDAA